MSTNITQRYFCYKIFYEAWKNGLIKPQPCEVCNVATVQAHHDDYTKPLEVRWLCKKHHNEIKKGKTKTKESLPKTTKIKIVPDNHWPIHRW